MLLSHTNKHIEMVCSYVALGSIFLLHVNAPPQVAFTVKFLFKALPLHPLAPTTAPTAAGASSGQEAALPFSSFVMSIALSQPYFAIVAEWLAFSPYGSDMSLIARYLLDHCNWNDVTQEVIALKMEQEMERAVAEGEQRSHILFSECEISALREEIEEIKRKETEEGMEEVTSVRVVDGQRETVSSALARVVSYRHRWFANAVCRAAALCCGLTGNVTACLMKSTSS